MALTAVEILDNPALHSVLKFQSMGLLALADRDPRLGAVFATQQRWLMSHVGLSLYFRGLTEATSQGLYITAFLQAVEDARIASRNTADAYIKEMIKYKYVEVLHSPRDRRARPLAPAPQVLAMITAWLRIHLASLDRLTGGERLAAFDRDPGVITRIQPWISEQLVSARGIRHPEKTFSLFTWLDNGGMVMDWLIASMAEAPMTADHVDVGHVSIPEMAHRLILSRTHLARKLREAEAMGSIGWRGRRGHSVMWVSRGFREEYAIAQSLKLAIIDAACESQWGRAPALSAAAPVG